MASWSPHCCLLRLSGHGLNLKTHCVSMAYLCLCATVLFVPPPPPPPPRLRLRRQTCVSTTHSQRSARGHPPCLPPFPALPVWSVPLWFCALIFLSLIPSPPFHSVFRPLGFSLRGLARSPFCLILLLLLFLLLCHTKDRILCLLLVG